MTNAEAGDLARRRNTFWRIWGLPIVIVVAVQILPIPIPIIVAVWTAGLAWMGGACLVNARRCRRRHCYVSGPVLLMGAVATALVGFRIVYIGRDGLNIVPMAMVVLIALSFVPELIWGKYRR